MKFSTKLNVFILAIVTITGIVITVFVYTSNLKMLEKEIIERLEGLAVEAMDKIDRNLYERYSDIQMMATDPIISSRNSTPKQITKRLVEYRNTYKSYISLSFLDLNRMLIADTAGVNIGKQYRLCKFFKDALQGNISAASDIHTSSQTGNANIYFASPVRDEEGVMFGVVVARMPIGKLYEITKSKARGHEDHRYEILEIDLIDEAGLLLYSSHNKKGILKDNLFVWKDVKRSVAAGRMGSFTRFDDGMEEIYVFIREQGHLDFRGNNWTLLIHVPIKAAFAPVIELRNKLIAVVFAIAFIAILITLIGSRRFTRSISRLKDVVKEIGEGKLDTKITISTKDEIGDLAASFRRMTGDLQWTTVSKDYTDNIIKFMLDCLVVVDLDAKIRTVNKASCDLLGYKEGELIGKDVSLLFPEEERTFKGTILQKLIEEGAISNYEVNFKTKGGNKISVLFSGAVMRKIDCQGGGPIEDCPEFKKNGKHCEKLQGIVVVAKDITERKKAEEERERLTRDLQQAQKLESVGQLAAGIAHEINTPAQFVGDNINFLKNAFSDMSGLQAKQRDLLEAAKNGKVSKETIETVEKAVETADIEFLTEEIPKAIDQSSEGIECISRIVKAMKDFAHPGAAGMTNSNLNKAIETTITVAKSEWKYVSEMKTELEPNLPSVPCLVNEFNQVILNLIVNARDTIADVVGNSGSKGTITISTSHDDRYAEIRVSDTGKGIPENIRKRIFDPFFTTKEVGKGSGQGLSIAYNVIAKKHHGEFFLETEEGKGTTFIIKLPLEVMNK